jgi:hypothetical protein
MSVAASMIPLVMAADFSGDGFPRRAVRGLLLRLPPLVLADMSFVDGFIESHPDFNLRVNGAVWRPFAASTPIDRPHQR